MGFTWKVAEAAALDRQEWRSGVAQCVDMMRDKLRSCQMAFSDSKG